MYVVPVAKCRARCQMLCAMPKFWVPLPNVVCVTKCVRYQMLYALPNVVCVTKCCALPNLVSVARYCMRCQVVNILLYSVVSTGVLILFGHWCPPYGFIVNIQYRSKYSVANREYTYIY